MRNLRFLPFFQIKALIIAFSAFHLMLTPLANSVENKEPGKKIPSQPSAPSEKPTSPQAKVQTDKKNQALNPDLLVQANNAFAFQLYRNLNAGNENICISPYSVSSAFAMVYTGSGGTTQTEIGSVLHFSNPPKEINSTFAQLDQFLTYHPSSIPGDFLILIANSLWVQSNQTVLPDFIDAMSKFFKAGLKRVDFIKHADTARSEINRWTKEKTQNKITDLLSAKEISNTTRMILVSTLYLKAKWMEPFDTRVSQPVPFFKSEEETKLVPMMTQTAIFPYLHTEDFAILEMPYVKFKNGPELAMIFVLPHQNQGLAEVEKSLTAESLSKWTESLKEERVIVTIPKFKISEAVNLNETLQKMGMRQAFSDAADFSGISPIKNLKISQVLQKTLISVDEGGTEAAAATSVSMTATAVLNTKEPIIFRADHPFVFAIIEKKTGSILFLGRLVNPKNDIR